MKKVFTGLQFDGNNKKVFVVGKAKLNLKGIELYKANPAIYQKEGSTVKIDKCYFKNNTNLTTIFIWAMPFSRFCPKKKWSRPCVFSPV